MNQTLERSKLGTVLLMAVLVGAGGLLPGWKAAAQTKAPRNRKESMSASALARPKFEVASVKRSSSRENSSFRITPGMVIIRNQPVASVIKFAYGHDVGPYGFSWLRDSEVLGGPGWIRSGYEGYDVVAKVPDALAAKFGKDCGSAFYHGVCSYRKQILLMLQSLLADRFKLKVKRETKQGRVYDLCVTKHGPKFLHTRFALADAGVTNHNQSLGPLHPEPCPAAMFCTQGYISMVEVADWLSGFFQANRPVINQTGLKGRYYIKVQWGRGQRISPNARLGAAPQAAPAGPSIFTALREQLGLKLKPAKGPVKSLIIEHIERPSPN